MTMRKIIRTQQPQTPCGIDWSNPLTRALEIAISPRANAESILAAGAGKSTVMGVSGENIGFFNGLPVTRDRDRLLISNTRPDKTILLATLDGSVASTTDELHCNDGGFSKGSWRIRRNNSGRFLNIVNEIGVPSSTAVAVANGPNVFVFRTSISNIETFRNGIFISADVIPKATVVPNSSYAIGIGSGAVSNHPAVLALVFSRALSNAEIKSLSDNPWQIFQPLSKPIYTNNQDIVLPSKGYPAKDLSKGLWTGFSPDNVNNSLVDKIDEPALDTNDYIYTDYPSTTEFELSETQFPGTGGHQLSYNVASSVGAIATVVMRQGMTEIAKWEHPLTNTDDTYTQTLTSEQIARITAGPITVSIDTRQPS